MATRPLKNYDIGDEVTMRASFTTRELTDAEFDTFSGDGSLPAGIGENLDNAVVCHVRKPDGTVVSVPVGHIVAGSYFAEVVVDQSGRWWYAFDGTDSGFQQSEERSFNVRRRQVPR